MKINSMKLFMMMSKIQIESKSQHRKNDKDEMLGCL